MFKATPVKPIDEGSFRVGDHVKILTMYHTEESGIVEELGHDHTPLQEIYKVNDSWYFAKELKIGDY